MRAAPAAGWNASQPLGRGGNAVRGVGESFSANPALGMATLTIPVPISSGRSGFSPAGSLVYDAGAGNGIFGLGWAFASSAIVRRTDRGLPTYDDAADSDAFVLTGQDELVPALVDTGDGWIRDERVEGAHQVRRYRPRTEGSFARIERWTNADGEAHWRVITSGNVTSIYGRSAAARIADEANESRVFSWLLDESFDDKGNVIVYEYKLEDLVGVPPSVAEVHRQSGGPARHLKRIRYGNRVPGARDDWLFTVVFDYGDHDPAAPAIAEDRPWPARNDPFSTCRPGFEVRTYRRCRRILMFHEFAELGPEPSLVRSLDLVHEDDPAGSRLVSAELAGYVRTDGGYQRESLPPLTLGYTPVVFGGSVATVDDRSLAGLPATRSGVRQQWIDLEGEGLPGLLSEEDGAWLYKRNLGGARFGPARQIAQRPSTAEPDGAGQAMLVLAGAERPSLVDVRPGLQGYSERTADGWRPFRPFRSFPSAAFGSVSLRLIDLTGDGNPDLLECGDGMRWYPAIAGEGFGAARLIAEPDAADDRPTTAFSRAGDAIRVADMTGDGLADLVQVDNGRVRYWPNLGHGRFGPQVTMTNGPVFDRMEDFDEGRIRLADVDGSGTTDLVYLGRDGVRVWRNESGNGWSAAHIVGPLPDAVDPSVVQVVDLLGSGTATLVLVLGNARWRGLDALSEAPLGRQAQPAVPDPERSGWGGGARPRPIDAVLPRRRSRRAGRGPLGCPFRSMWSNG